MKIPTCIPLYLQKTGKGNRNQNMFHAINHVRRFNPETNITELTNTAQELNKQLPESLTQHEVKTITKSVMRREYKSSCKKYRTYCPHFPCELVQHKKPFNQLGSNWWKYIDKNNLVYNIPGIGNVEIYPWEIMDTSKLSDVEVDRIYELRRFKGINPLIDRILKLKGIPVGDEALNLWNEYRYEG